MTYAQDLGKFAENTAAEYFLSLGWKVLERNVKNHYGELDIIAIDTSSKPEELVIAEVRCRTLGKIQTPLDSIGIRKLRTLIRASQELINNNGWSGFWRIDVIGITIHEKYNREKWELEHVKDITAGMNISC